MGYGYQERDLDKTVIDWSGLTKDISDNLNKESNRREELKFQIEKTQSEELQKISEYEQGQDPEANQWAMKQAQQAREFKMMNHKMMKQGFISVNDAKLISQNVMDGWSTLNKGLSTYNENYNKLLEAGGKGNQFLAGELAKFADIKNKSIWNDPKTGVAYFVNVDPETGKLDTSNLRPVKSLTNIQAQKFETIDVEAETAKLAQNTAAYEMALSSTSSLENARKNPAYLQWRDNSLKSVLSSDQRIASVLMDYLNVDPTSDLNDSETNTITYKAVTGYNSKGEPEMTEVTKNIGKVKMEYVNGKLSPKLTDEQKKYASDAFIASLENKLAFKTKKQYVAPQRPTAGQTKDKGVARSIERFVKDGDFSQLKSALTNKKFTSSKAPDPKTGIFSIYDKAGNKFDINTKGKTAKQVALELAGPLGVNEAIEKRNIQGDYNKNILTNISGYGVYSSKETSISPTDTALISAAKAENKPGGVLNAVQRAGKSIGLKASDISMDDSGQILYRQAVKDGKGNTTYEFKVVGDANTTAETLAEELSKYKKGGMANF